jgi:hypothetical protein
VKPRQIATALLLLAFLCLALAFLTGCAASDKARWNLGVSAEPDFKSANPDVSFGLCGSF